MTKLLFLQENNMYAKLVVGASDANVYQCIRDMCRLLTSATPSISDLSGQGFNTSSSAILDDTPAGWTFVGSNKTTDTPTIGAGAADATLSTTTYHNWAVSAPMADDAAKLKYALFTAAFIGISNTTPFKSMFSLSGAESVNSSGVATNEGYRQGNSGTGTTILNANLHVGSGSVIHLIANARHITVVQEAKGMMALWETNTTDVHTFYNKPAFVTYAHPHAAAGSIGTISVSPIPNTGTTSTNIIAGVVFGVTNPNTGTFSGTYDISVSNTQNILNLFQTSLTARANSINASGNPRYQISPVFFQASSIGYPVQYVTGMVPIYWCRAGLGSSGDNVDINGDVYTYFNAANTGGAFGVLLKTD
jgi:hypothetical protein